jgi:glycosyltransferase involved in cell wall biosynthesis
MENKVQKIIYVITKSNFGGAQKYIFELATKMTDSGKDVLVIFGGNGELKNKLEEKNIKNLSLDSLTRDINFFSDLKNFVELIKIFKRENPDVIHLNSSKIGGIGALAGRIANIFGNKSKIIFTIHGWAFNEDRNWFLKLLIKKLYWLTIFMSHISIAVSNTTKNEGNKIPFYFLIRNKVIVIKNSIKEIDFFDREIARNFIGQKIGKNLNENSIVVGSLCELHEIKGLNYFIEAISKLNDKNIFGVIFGEGEKRKELEKMITDKSLKNNLFLCGQIENAAQYLKGFDIYLSSSLSEGFSLALLEAKQAGLKIIATDIGSNVEALSDYKNSINIEPKNPNDIAQKIEIMANNKDIIEIKNTNTFSEMVENILEIYSA